VDKNTSPVGWYVASYLLRFVELDRKDIDDPEAKFLSWENTVLVKAIDLDEAYDKTVRIAEESTKPYKGGPDGVDVQWQFEGVTQLVPVYEQIEDGAEIMWAEHAPRKLKNLRKWVGDKGAFRQ
jgi:hypothetical protein